jgi:hypothetical protein
MTTSLTTPLIPVKVIETKICPYKILRAGHELILGGSYQYSGCLEVFDIETSSITHTLNFKEGGYIHDMIAIYDTHYLLGASGGLLKTTKDQLINHYHKGKYVKSLCHITDSVYLVGFGVYTPEKLIAWNEQSD